MILGISSIVQIHGKALELVGVVRKRLVKVLIYSGSKGNYISASTNTAWAVVPMPNENNEEVTLANVAKVQTEGHVQFQMQCGEFKGTIHPKVFPLLHKEFILGMPWLRREDPDISCVGRHI